VPLLALSAATLFGKVGELTTLSQTIYAEAGAVAEESISSIRTVASFNGEQRIVQKYEDKVHGAEKVGISVGVAIGRGVGELVKVLLHDDEHTIGQ